MPISIFSSNLSRDNNPLAEICAPGLKGSDGSEGNSYKLKYDIVMQDICGPRNVLARSQEGAPDPVPSAWSTYSYKGDVDEHSYAKQYTIERHEQCQTRYFVTVHFAPADPGDVTIWKSNPAVVKREPDPIKRVPLIWWDRKVVSKLEELDEHDTNPAVDPAPILTKALTLYDEVIEHDRGRSVMVVEFNVADDAAVTEITRKFEQAVNSVSFSLNGLVIPERVALVNEVSGGLNTTEGKYNYTPVTMRFEFAHLNKTWDVPKAELSQFYFKKDSDGAYILEDGFRKRYDAGLLVPINDDGTRRSDDDPVVITKHRVRREVDFNELPFLFV